jgi:gliding motility-associated GldN-like protein
MAFKSTFTSALTCFFLLIFTNFKSFAQYNELQNDPSITWIAEFTTDYNFSLTVDYSKEVVKLIKFYDAPSDTDDSNMDSWIPSWLFRNAMNRLSECYKDPSLTQKLSEKEFENLISSTDTVVTFYQETYEEVVQVIRNELSSDQISGLRINQIIYYNTKTDNFQTRIISVAPLLESKNKESMRPLFWIKMNESFPQEFNIHSPEISWGAVAYSRSNPLALNFLEVIKNTADFNFNNHIYQQAINMTKPIESSEGFGSKEMLKKNEIEILYNSIDTVYTFDPATFEEQVLIIKNELNPNEISQYRLVQEWYYDSKKRKLLNHLKAIAPIVDVQDSTGEFKYSKPLYYIRYN